MPVESCIPIVPSADLEKSGGLPSSGKWRSACLAVLRHALTMPAGVVSPPSALGPSTSRITTARSRSACAPSP